MTAVAPPWVEQLARVAVGTQGPRYPEPWPSAAKPAVLDSDWRNTPLIAVLQHYCGVVMGHVMLAGGMDCCDDEVRNHWLTRKLRGAVPYDEVSLVET
jgi:hypothetical protein